MPAAVTESVRAVTEQALAEAQRAVGAQADAVRRVLAINTPGTRSTTSSRASSKASTPRTASSPGYAPPSM